jgi:hypothetical protein
VLLLLLLLLLLPALLHGQQWLQKHMRCMLSLLSSSGCGHAAAALH